MRPTVSLQRKSRGRSYQSRWWVALLFLVLLGISLFACSAEAKGIYATVEAPWTETPFFMEGSEWVADVQGNSAFFEFLEDLWQTVRDSPASSSESVSGRGGRGGARDLSQHEQYRVLEKIIASTPAITAGQRALLPMDMAARFYSPAVEAHFTLAAQAALVHSNASRQQRPQCEGQPFVELYKPGAADPLFIADAQVLEKELHSLKDMAAPARIHGAAIYSALDHAHPLSSSLSDARAVMILYGLAGESRTRLLYEVLTKFMTTQSTYLVYRHLPVSVSRACGQAQPSDDGNTAASSEGAAAYSRPTWMHPLYVQGYAATVDLKNMEYKVVDEQRQKGEAAAAAVQHDTADPVSSLSLDEHAHVGGFHIDVLKSRLPELTVQLDGFASAVEDFIGTRETKVDFDLWELQNVGLAAAQYISEAAEEKRWSVLMDIVTRFPMHASTLSRLASVPARYAKVEGEIAVLQRILGGGKSLLFLNGREVPAKQLSLFAMLSSLRTEEAVMAALEVALTSRPPDFSDDDWWGQPRGSSVSVTDDVMLRVTNYVKRTVRRRAFGAATGAAATAAPRLAVSQECIVWLNDIETNPLFASLPRHLSVAFQRSPYGFEMMPRRNLVHVVFIIDPTEEASLSMIALAHRMMRQGVLARFGVVVADPHWKESFEYKVDGQAETPGEPRRSANLLYAAATIYKLNQRHGNRILDYLMQLMTVLSSRKSPQRMELAVQQVSNEALRGASRQKVDQLVGEADFLRWFHLTQKTVRDSRLTTYPTALVNGAKVSGGWPEVWLQIQAETNNVRELIKAKLLNERMTDFYEEILNHYGATTRHQPALDDGVLMHPWATKPLVEFVESRPYLYASTYEVGAIAVVTNVLVLPPRPTCATLRMLLTHLKALETCSGIRSKERRAACQYMRTTLATPPSSSRPLSALSQLEHVLRGASHLSEPKRVAILRSYVEVVLARAERRGLAPNAALAGLPALGVADEDVDGELPAVLRSILQTPLSAAEEEHQRGLVDLFWQDTVRNFASVLAGDSEELILIVNGRGIKVDHSFMEEDHIEAAYRQSSVAQVVKDVLDQVDFLQLNATDGFTADELSSDFFASKTAAVASALLADDVRGDRGALREQDVLPKRKAEGSITFHVDPQTSKAAAARHQLTMVVDPSSREAQLLVSLCNYFVHSPLGVRLTIHLNPSTSVSKPIRNLYSYVASPELTFDAQAGEVVPPAAVFRGLPAQQLLTLGIEEPESWTVFPHDAEDDLDNIILARLPTGTQFLTAGYRINSLLVAGSALLAERGENAPPSGLPLSLTSTATGRATDTLVMSNLGYYQLQAAPGVWHLSVQPGPLAATFYIKNVEDGSTQLHSEVVAGPSEAGQRLPIVVHSFLGNFAKLEVAHVPGREHLSLSSIADTISHATHVWPPKKRGAQRDPPPQPTLNIFSVASGHLYERFLRMMMYSVYTASSDKFGANTTRIKFWLIENFLSPQFKAFVPRMAAHYGFEVEFVTYQWPWWLPKQTEKQRKIWAYKILFLDVLFPWKVDRVIFVDADQTDLADLHELYNMNIDGSPLAMTPFCTRHMNKATKGFRFWSEGFWVEHLKGLPYHISAIFLVDLQRFRAMRAGDQYRIAYSQLTQDSNSLANLDQDLPNFMQSSVPIFSLPEEWLWCETWCSAESKSHAKTIDLCNNPLTKVPKLQNAKTIIPNWSELDETLENLSIKLMRSDRG